ncbi:metal-dependent hydrolase [Plasticicumulans sp.]|uniref:metal-dependent hydrolase n=1 Tax=Plasticicumulans sp. TaxID=2307179 RepID=UPI002C43ECF3|nr:metal-dependent hydrolase [Plasticicumulans sp.]HMZ11732.1 metal-dependent hydrolase [Plasticicumulans sp.]HNG51299.1 metal-dependent hydrolase [Plasticicumulans sp.]HNJ09418.1 metal-dependent hydrolase [Plasticicumulans sp.]HNM44354.1 metal-dependent hydrolase [Plasticicumulans sp.]
MDSVTQIALGAALGVAVLGRQGRVWRAVLTGAVVATLPDLDAFIDHGDAIRNMTLHRAESHALFWLTLASIPLTALVVAIWREPGLWRRWWLAVWLMLLTHPLLDTMTIYGTQLALPWSDEPWGIGSVFIIDPLYTLALLIGTGVALVRRADARGRRWNAAGLVLSTLYLGWGLGAQQLALARAEAALAAAGQPAVQVLALPTAFNSLLWRLVVITPDDGWLEGYTALPDAGLPRFERFPRGEALFARWRHDPAVARLARFTHGYWQMRRLADGRVVITDLRMGQQPWFTFEFVVGRDLGAHREPAPATRIREPPPVATVLRWIVHRIGDESLPPPRLP